MRILIDRYLSAFLVISLENTSRREIVQQAANCQGAFGQVVPTYSLPRTVSETHCSVKIGSPKLLDWKAPEPCHVFLIIILLPQIREA